MRRTWMRRAWMGVVFWVMIACSKPEPAPAMGDPAATATATEATPSSSAAASATSTPTSTSTSTPTPTPTSTSTAKTTPTPTTKPTPSTTASAAPPPACGDKPLPDCPLKAWMKANTAPAMAAADMQALAAALDKIATFAPSAYPNWASISKDGAAAARADSMDGVKASCRSCHEQYKSKYKEEMRARPLP